VITITHQALMAVEVVDDSVGTRHCITSLQHEADDRGDHKNADDAR
jgi:hypothetical protein